MAKQNKISGQFAARLIEMMESPAYRVLSLSAHRALSRIEVEWAHHGGQDNGRLPVTFDDFERYGMNRHAIGPALAELEALGFIVISEHGKMAVGAEYRRPNKSLLTSRPERRGADPLCKWRRFKTLEEAQAVGDTARGDAVQKKKPPVRKTHQKPVRKTHHSGEIASAENAPLSSAETAPLSISREDTPPLGEGGGAGPPRLTSTGLALTLVADAPTPDDALHSQSPTDLAAGKAKLVWSKPVVIEIRGVEKTILIAQAGFFGPKTRLAAAALAQSAHATTV